MEVKVYIESIETQYRARPIFTRTSCSAQRGMHHRELDCDRPILVYFMFLWGVFVKSYIDNQLPLCF